MQKKDIFPVGIILFIAITFVCAIAFSIEFGPEKIRIDDVTKATNRYIGVDFYHARHVMDRKITCVTCHHEQNEDFVSGSAPKCSICHNADAEISFKDSMHKTCVVCHLNKVAMGKNPPTECLSCHIQRK